jgi:hypothetical protein
MTISSTTVRNSYSGDGTTDTFTYNFKIFQDSDIQVIIRSANGTETIKTITTHYTVTDAGVSAGGTVVFTAGNIPTATETVVLRRNIPQTQAIDYIANDPFPAESHEEGLDRATMAIQQIQEEVTRSLKLSKTNTMTSTEFTVGAADRANKILAFDAAGEISVTQELGTYKGTDTTITTEAYVQRDIVKSTSATQLNNVYICVGDSVVGDLLTDTDHFDLLVDAVSAAASATAAASSATDAETAQTAAETAQTAAELAQTKPKLQRLMLKLQRLMPKLQRLMLLLVKPMLQQVKLMLLLVKPLLQQVRLMLQLLKVMLQHLLQLQLLKQE